MGVNKKVAVLGLWHLGMITSLGLAELGHTITAYDPDKKTIRNLQKGIPPLYEPQLEDYLKKHLNSAISFTHNLSDITDADFIYITFDTPLNEKDEVDISGLIQTMKHLAKFLKKDSIVIVSSQVPVGTLEKFKKIMLKENKKVSFEIAYQPENLRLGKAFERFFHPAMIVIGSDKKETYEKIISLYKTVKTNKIFTNIKTAEFIKHAINTYLATSISYANELGNIADKVGADFWQASRILRLDERIGPNARVSPGLGFAGGTLARDLKILQKIGNSKKYDSIFIDAILKINDLQKKWVVTTLKTLFKSSLQKKKVGIVGLTYTQQTSTLRRSMSVEIIQNLLKYQAKIHVFDPNADASEVKKIKHIKKERSLQSLFEKMDAIVIMLSFPDLYKIHFETKHKKRQLIIDPNNILADKNLAGFTYVGFGRGMNEV